MTLLEIGRLVKPHGVRGEVKARLHWADSTALERAKTFVLRREGQPDATMTIESSRPAGRFVLLKLKGIDSPEAVEPLRNGAVCLPRSELPALEPGEYYLADLLGMQVVGPEGPVGRVAEIRSYPSVDAIAIEAADGRVLEQALVDAWIEEVQVEERVLRLASLDGLIEP